MSADDEKEADYQVGYKRPPRHSQFKPGFSGNRKGRPAGRRNLKTDLQEELSERLTLRDGDRKIRMTKQRAMVKQTVASAIKGDIRAQVQAYRLLLLAFGMDDELKDAGNVDANDADILASYLDRISKGSRP